MRKLLFLLLLSSQLSFTQNVILLDSIPLKADTFIGVDDFENYYYTIGNTLYKKSPQKTYSYANTQLGNITSIDITNPLKILLFYSGFNTIVLLDNRLNEFTNTINLNTESFAKNVAFAGISSNNNIWLFSKDDNTLSLWNYKTKATVFESQPLSFYGKDFKAISLKSGYKFCYIFSKQQFIKFDEYGSFIAKTNIPNENIYVYKDGYFYLKDKHLFFSKNENSTQIKDFSPKHKTNNMVIKNNFLYFFDSNRLYKYEVLKN